MAGVRIVAALLALAAGVGSSSFSVQRGPPISPLPGPPVPSSPGSPADAAKVSGSGTPSGPSPRRDRIVYPAGQAAWLTLPDQSREPVRSLLRTQRPLRYGEWLWNDAGIPPGRTWVRIDLDRQVLSVFRQGHEIGTSVILYGADRKPTPVGVYPVLERAVAHRSTLYDADMPYMLRLTPDGVAIHASKVRVAAATHGCIGVPLDFAKKLFSAMRRGDRVAIVRSASHGHPAGSF